MRKALLSIVAVVMVAPLTPVAAQQASPTREIRTAPAPRQSLQDQIEFDRQAAQLQENMSRMQDQMNRIRQTGDPQERQRLLQEHRAMMQQSMSQMHAMRGYGAGMNDMGGMGGGDIPGSGMGPNMRGQFESMTPAQLGQRQYMLEERLRQHQMMIDQMMQHHEWQDQAQIGPQSEQLPSPWRRSTE